MKAIFVAVFAACALLLGCGDGGIEGRAESAVDKLCGCKDAKCFEQATNELDKIGEEIDKKGEKSFSESTMKKLEQLKDRAEDCEGKAKENIAGAGAGKDAGKIEELVAEMEKLADKACACKDADCASKVADEMSKLGSNPDNEALDQDALMRAAREPIERFGECMNKAAGAGE